MSEGLKIYARSLVLFPYRPWIDGAYWSLCVEIAFYTLVWLALKRGASIEKLLMVLTVLSAGFWSLYLLSFASADLNPAMMQASKSWMTSITLLQYGGLFGFGGVIWLVHSHGLTASRALVGSFAFASSVISICATVANQAIDLQFIYPVGIFCLAIGGIVLSLRWRPSPAVTKACKRIGALTYPLYLVHHQTGRARQNFVFGAGMSGWLALASAIVAVVLIAWTVQRHVEPRVRAVIVNWLERMALARAKHASARRSPP